MSGKPTPESSIGQKTGLLYFKIEWTRLKILFSSIEESSVGVLWNSRTKIEWVRVCGDCGPLSDVCEGRDVGVRCACGLFVRGPGKQHQPRRASTPSCGSIPAGKGGLEQGRSLLLIPVLSLSSSNPLRGTEGSGTDTALRVGQLLIKGAQR